MKKKVVLFFTCLFLYSCVNAQLTVTPNADAQKLVEAILGKGFVVSNAKLDCPVNAIGNFVNNTSDIGLGQGIILSTGSVKSMIIGVDDSTFTGGNGDADLEKLAGNITFDACKLEFDLLPSCDSLKIRYVFGSDEYPEFVGGYNDAFAFFISGPGITGTVNMATIPNTTLPVTVNNINAGTNSQYFVDNGTNRTISLDGYTVPLMAYAKVIPCQTYHLKIAIADAVDSGLDSGVLGARNNYM